MLALNITVPAGEIAFFCQRWNISELSLFGSVLRDDFTPQSDVDVLVSFSPAAEISLFDLAQMQIELQGLFKHPVDIIEKEALRNPYRKREILSTARLIYEA
ncbi:MAG: nucleotidyltransferase domain-containing protein [Chloroflexota bacterium]